ncbi:MAG TPA: AraC family transcriptional regulator ligand-binding domain-containing protein [Kofleriaceae bacterium]|nr:AraC family transcriptional regulator ligand-binding domain-containing protein [Kofleriaceae bacterium]
MTAAHLFTFRMTPVIGAWLVKAHVDPRALLREIGLPQEALAGDLTAPLQRIQELVDRAALLLERPLLGLDLVDFAQPGTFGLAEFVGRFAPTVRQGLEAFCEAMPLVNPTIEWRYAPGKSDSTMELTVPGSGDGLGPQLNEFAVGIVLKLANTALERPLRLTRAWFAHTRRDRAQIDEVAKRLGAPTTFGDATCGFAFAAEDAELAPRMADPALFDFHAKETRNQIESLGGTDDVIAHVCRIIEMRLPQGDLSIEAIARALAITHRTLQRRLTSAGTSYREVLVHVRRRRRAVLLRDRIPDAKIAELLGFADIRAMKRSLD